MPGGPSGGVGVCMFSTSIAYWSVFSRLRPTRFHANLAWVRGSWRNFRNLSKLPSRVALFDLGRQELCWEYVVETAGMNIIFSILPVRERELMNHGAGENPGLLHHGRVAKRLDDRRHPSRSARGRRESR